MKWDAILQTVARLASLQPPPPPPPPPAPPAPPAPVRSPDDRLVPIHLRRWWAASLTLLVIVTSLCEVFYPHSPWREVLHEIGEAVGTRPKTTKPDRLGHDYDDLQPVYGFGTH